MANEWKMEVKLDDVVLQRNFSSIYERLKRLIEKLDLKSDILNEGYNWQSYMKSNEE